MSATDSSSKTNRQCVKVKYLRTQTGCNNLKEWLENEDNVLITRNGRVFIGSGEDKFVFPYPGHSFKNPYVVLNPKKVYKRPPPNGVATKEESLRLFEEHLNELLTINAAKEELKSLKGKTLGCFCPPEEACHVDVVIKYIEEINDLASDMEQLEI